MVGKAHWIVQESKILQGAPETEVQGRQSDAVDEHIVLPGESISLSIVNGSLGPRWYQVVITHLDNSEYSLHSNLFGTIDPDTLVMLNPNEQCDLVLYLERDPEHPRSTPCIFEIVVTEYSTQDTDGPSMIYFYKQYKLIPAFNTQFIGVETHAKTVYLRPWQRAARLEMTVSNRNYLPISARLRLNLLDNKGRPISMDDGEIVLDLGMLEGMHAQRIACLLPLEQKLQQPLRVQPVVEATVPRTGERVQRNVERFIQLVPVPFLKTWWPDWLIAGVALVLLIGLLFGFPPLYRPEARIRLHFEGLPVGQLPAGLDPRDLKVSVEITDTRGVKYSYICLYRPYTEHGVTGVEFYKRWAWQKRGLRFLWTPQPLSLKVEPEPRRDQTGKVSAKLKPYNLDDLQVDPNWAVDPAEPGVVPPVLTVSIPYKQRVEIPVRLPAGWPNSDTEVAVEVRVNGTPSKEGSKRISLSGGRPTQPTLSFDLTGQVEKGSEALVEVVGRSEPSNHVSRGSAKIKAGFPAPPIAMPPPKPSRPEYTLSIQSDPPGATVYLDGQEAGLTPYETRSEVPSGKNQIAILLKREGYKDYATQKLVHAGARVVINAKLTPVKESPPPAANPAPATPAPANIEPATTEPAPNAQLTKRWLTLLGIPEIHPRFHRGNLRVNIEIIPQGGQDVVITVSANKPCWVQVYQCDPRNYKHEPIWGWDSFRQKIRHYPKRQDPPQDEVLKRIASKDKALKLPLRLESEDLEFVVVALTQLPQGVQPQKNAQGEMYVTISDSLAWLVQASPEGEWAVDGSSKGR